MYYYRTPAVVKFRDYDNLFRFTALFPCGFRIPVDNPLTRRVEKKKQRPKSTTCVQKNNEHSHKVRL